MKVLVSAYACEPDKGSEPGVGWNWVKAISRHADTWVITKANNRAAIEKALRVESIDRLHFEYVDLPRWLSFWKKGQRGVRTYYYLWQFAALVSARRLLRTNSFDLAHHVTFVTDWVWTFLALMPIPFIWGPIGSNSGIPRQFFKSRRGLILDTVKNTFQSLVRSLDPLFWISVLRALKILCINQEVANLFPIRIVAQDKIDIEVAIGVEDLPAASSPENQSKIHERLVHKVLFIGRFIAIKGPDLALEAFAKYVARVPEARLTMAGEGPLLLELKHLRNELGIEGKVSFVPWAPRAESLRLFQDHDLFLFPSVEGGGMVVLEAMATGLPVVCLDFGGPGQMVSDEQGIKVAIGNRAEMVDGLSEALFQILQDSKWFEVSQREGIRQTIRSRFSWTAKEQFVANLYDNAVSRSTSDFR